MCTRCIIQYHMWYLSDRCLVVVDRCLVRHLADTWQLSDNHLTESTRQIAGVWRERWCRVLKFHEVNYYVYYVPSCMPIKILALILNVSHCQSIPLNADQCRSMPDQGINRNWSALIGIWHWSRESWWDWWISCQVILDKFQVSCLDIKQFYLHYMFYRTSGHSGRSRQHLG